MFATRGLAALDEELKVRLVHRTTRVLALTPETQRQTRLRSTNRVGYTHTTVDALNEPVLRRLARCDVMPLNACLARP
jgi:hypothetical protein